MDRQEVSELYHRLGPLIYRRCLRLLADPEGARDATQEVFVRTLKHAGKLRREDRDCLPWLYRVATNYCLNKIRDGRRLEFRQPEKLPEPLIQSNCEKWLSARQQLLALMSRVDKKTQAIVVYIHMDGMTQEETARLTGFSRRTVGKKLNQFAKLVEELVNQEQVA